MDAAPAGNPQAVLTCRTCRKRKVKCPGQRPRCANCIRREDECEYDAIITRRGKDKVRGGRIKPLQPAEVDLSPAKPNEYPLDGVAAVDPSSYTPLPARSSLPPSLGAVPTSALPFEWKPHEIPTFTMPRTLLSGDPTINHTFHQTTQTSTSSQLLSPLFDSAIPGMSTDSTSCYIQAPSPYGSLADPGGISLDGLRLHGSKLLIEAKSIVSATDGWWDWILDGYRLPSREDAQQTVITLCQDFFADPHIWLTALHPGLFLSSLSSPSPVNPRDIHLILAILAHSTFHQSDNDAPALMRALRFAEESKKLIDASLSAGGTDPSLAHAALILAVFEFQPHVSHSAERSNEALEFLIKAGKMCWVLDLDKDVEKDVMGTRFGGSSMGMRRNFTRREGDFADHDASDKWAVSPPWGDVPVDEIRREEMRRMCWIANSMTSSLSLWHSMIGQRWTIAPLDFDQVMYPGEALLRSQGLGEDSVKTPWALYHRSVAICQFVATPGTSPALTQAVNVQLEEIQRDLASLDPSKSSTYTWQAQNWLSVIRRRLGLSKPEHVHLWFERQLAWVKSFTDPLSILPRPRNRPLYCWWYLMIGTSALSLVKAYPANQAMAKEVVSYCVQAVEEITRRYPCEGESKRTMGKRGTCADPLFIGSRETPRSAKGTIKKSSVDVHARCTYRMKDKRGWWWQMIV